MILVFRVGAGIRAGTPRSPASLQGFGELVGRSGVEPDTT